MKKAFAVVLSAALITVSLAQAQQANEIRIGALNPLTGSGSPYGPGMQQAIKLAVSQVNLRGGVMGKKIRLFTEDTGTDPETAVRAAKKLLDVNKVQAILGTWSSGVTMAVVPLTIKAGAIEMSVSGAPQLTTLVDDDLVYRTQASNTLFGEVFAEVAKRNGFKRAATLAFNNPSGIGNTTEFAKQFKADGGTVTSTVVYDGGRASYRTEIEKTLAAKPDVIVMGSYLADTTIILKELYQLGENIPVIAPAWAINPELVKAIGPAAEGAFAVDALPNLGTKGYDFFKSAYQKVSKSDPVTNPYAAMVYDQVIVLALAMEAAKSTDPKVYKAKIRDVSAAPGKLVYSYAEGVKELSAGRDINYEGASSSIDFDKAGDVRPNFGIFQVKKGVLVLTGQFKP